MTFHPAHVLDDEDRAVLELWIAYHGGGMAPGYLPFAGGYADQPSALMAALKAMQGAAAKVREFYGSGSG